MTAFRLGIKEHGRCVSSVSDLTGKATTFARFAAAGIIAIGHLYKYVFR